MKLMRATKRNSELQQLAEQMDKALARENEVLDRAVCAEKRGAEYSEISAIEDEARVHADEARTYVEKMLALDASSMEELVAKASGVAWCLGGYTALAKAVDYTNSGLDDRLAISLVADLLRLAGKTDGRGAALSAE